MPSNAKKFLFVSNTGVKVLYTFKGISQFLHGYISEKLHVRQMLVNLIIFRCMLSGYFWSNPS